MYAFRPARRTARSRAQIVPIAEVGRVPAFFLELQLLFVALKVLRGRGKQPREIGDPLPLGRDLTHEAPDLLEVRFVGARQLAVISRADFVEDRRPVGVVFL